ncbi:baseplate J/gp47 family protein [Pseudomonas gorinensis]
MPFTRPTLSDLRAHVAADITSGLPTADGLLRFSNMNVMGKALAGMAHLHYGYLDWIARQSVPFTCTGEYLEAWAALKKVYRKKAAFARGQVTFKGTPGVVIDAGTEVVRGDTASFTTLTTATINSEGAVIVSIIAEVAGEQGNTAIGSLIRLGSSLDGVQSTGAVTSVITGGADQEEDGNLFSRMIDAFQNTPKGGSGADYVAWAKEVSGVTRAWCAPNGFGAGTVIVYAMLDDANAEHGGFPQGRNGVSSKDVRATPANTATGDQLIIANSMFPEQPVTAMVYLCAPEDRTINFTLSGLTGASTATRDALAGAIAEVLAEQGAPLNDGSYIELSAVDSAIAAIAGTAGFVMTSPTQNIVNQLGSLPVLGSITYS